MTDEQFEQLTSKLDQLINLLQPKKAGKKVDTNQNGINALLHTCTHPEYDDKQYCEALYKISKLDFSISPKQFSWIMAYTFRHPNCGDSIQAFITNILKKVQDKKQYIDTVSFELRKHYTTQSNGEFIEGIIAHLKKMQMRLV